MDHSVEKCIHGTLVKQCRCIESHNNVVIVPCPNNCPKKDED